MNEKEVERLIGINNWIAFCKFMEGQTVGINRDGSIDYYEQDVAIFIRRMK